jgi:hypothetical protein
MAAMTGSSPPVQARRKLGLPVVATIGLALLGVPRVVLHDLAVIHEGTAVNALLVFAPPLVWIGVVLWKRVPNPFLTLLVVGAWYGLFLAVTHQLLWDVVWGDDPPTLGGNLQNLEPTAQSLIMRGFAAVSSLFTGLMVGVVTGLVAWGISWLRNRRPRD